jgi:hypothetical protein
MFDEENDVFQEQTNEKLRVLDTKLDTVMQQLAVLVGAGAGNAPARNEEEPVDVAPNYIVISNPTARKGPRTLGA